MLARYLVNKFELFHKNCINTEYFICYVNTTIHKLLLKIKNKLLPICK